MTTATDVPAEVPTMEEPLTLCVADRCDRCGAQAFVITQHEAGPLYWCGHHFGPHELTLRTVVDNRSMINRAPSPSV